MIKSTCPITIFEGPDGSGKTTAAKEFAINTGAMYIHHGPYTKFKGANLARMYVESMMPALLGYQAVVLDRCWLSEPIYGSAFRDGADRIGPVAIRQLERLALRCGAVVVNCLPGVDVVEENWQRRRCDELLENLNQLREVYRGYYTLQTDLPVVDYDFTSLGLFKPMYFEETFERQYTRTGFHPLSVRSAGSIRAPFLLVCEEAEGHTGNDPFYQWPYCSFGSGSDSAWLTRQLMLSNIPESELLWIPFSDLIGSPNIKNFTHTRGVIAISAAASRHLVEQGIPHTFTPGPHAWRAIHPLGLEEYPLPRLIFETEA